MFRTHLLLALLLIPPSVTAPNNQIISPYLKPLEAITAVYKAEVAVKSWPNYGDNYTNTVLRPLEAAQQAENQRLAVIAQEAENARIAAQDALNSYSANAYSPMMSIFMAESGNNPGAINASSGACGLGQALPCSKMPCLLSDYNCQVNFFTDYANSRYGGWPQAWAFWQRNRWW